MRPARIIPVLALTVAALSVAPPSGALGPGGWDRLGSQIQFGNPASSLNADVMAIAPYFNAVDAGDPARVATTLTLSSDQIVDQMLANIRGDIKTAMTANAALAAKYKLKLKAYESGAGDSTSRALGIGGFVDTPNHGALSVNANLVQQQSNAPGNQAQSSGSTWRIDQRALPLDGGWFANHSAGDINTVSTRLARGTGRVSVPATPIRGTRSRPTSWAR
jgi:hypothetical protein